MNNLEPITSKEHFLAALGGQDITPPEPVTLIETELNCILNGTPAPITADMLDTLGNIEWFLAIISGVSLDPIEPVTRIEHYLAKIAGMDVEPPEPINRVEHFLADWVEQGGGPIGELVTVAGTTPLTLANALAGDIRSLVQQGKLVLDGDNIVCNNGAVRMVDPDLPAGYKRLLGISFDGNFHYETGEYLTGDDDVTMTLDNLSSSGKNVFGSYNGANGKNFSLYIYGSSTSGSYFRFGDQLKRPKYGGTGRRTITFGAGGTSGFAEDVSIDPDEFTTPANTYIGMLPNSSSAAYTGDIVGSILVGTRLEWIPCESDGGVIGYYERVNGNFIAPTGDGTPVSLGYDNSHLVLGVVGDPEVLSVGAQIATVANLYAVGNYKDTQDIISGKVTRRTVPIVYDGTQDVGEDYVGDLIEGRLVVYAPSETYSGAVAAFETEAATQMHSLTTTLTPTQDMHGYDRPWPGGGGKNLLPNLGTEDTTVMGVQWTLNDDGSFYSQGDGSQTNSQPYRAEISLPAGTYFLSGCPSGGSNATHFLRILLYIGDALTARNDYGSGTTFDVTGNETRILVFANCNAQETDRKLWKPQIEAGTAATTYSPYENRCPITGHDSVRVWVQATHDTTADPAATVQLGQTVYGGTLDVVSGEMVLTMAMVDLGTLGWRYYPEQTAFYSYAPDPEKKYGFTNLRCESYTTRTSESGNNWNLGNYEIGGGNNSAFIYVKDPRFNNAVDFEQSVTGTKVVYELATPITIQLTPTQVSTILGQNRVWSDGDGVKVVLPVERIEYVDPQPMRASEGSNTVSVTSEVGEVELEVTYRRESA